MLLLTKILTGCFRETAARSLTYKRPKMNGDTAAVESKQRTEVRDITGACTSSDIVAENNMVCRL